jgi:hypothetical protein
VAASSRSSVSTKAARECVPSHESTVARPVVERRGKANATSFSTPRSVAEQAILDAAVRVDRMLRTVLGEALDVRQSLRETAQDLSGTRAA